MRISRPSWFTDNYQRWLQKTIPARDSVILHRRNIFIIPTPNGLLFGVSSLLIFIAAINYEVSMAFALAFFMASIFIIAILYSFNNLNQLRVQCLPSIPVFCGEDANFRVLLSREKGRHHEALQLRFTGSTITYLDLISKDQEKASVFIEATERGNFRAPRLRVTTYFPLGLCRAWTFVDLNMSCLVYPTPLPYDLDKFLLGSSGGGESSVTREGSDEFYGVREYVKGDSMSQVAWKNVARGQGMQVKQFVDHVDTRVWLDWSSFTGLDTEERLSRICYCVLQLAKKDTPYGLKLPGLEIEPDNNKEHRQKILTTLALFDKTESVESH